MKALHLRGALQKHKPQTVESVNADKTKPPLSLTHEYSTIRTNITQKLFIEVRLRVHVRTINWSGLRCDRNCDVLCQYHRSMETQ